MTAPPPKFCSNCGSRLIGKFIERRERQFCKECDRPVYQNPKPCAGVVVADDSRVLLVQRTQPPAVSAWSIPAGYLEADESPRKAATRELREETSLGVAYDSISIFDTAFIRHPNGNYVLVLVYMTSRGATTGEPVPGSDAGDAWFWRLNMLDEAGEQVELGYRSLLKKAIETG